MTYFVGQAVSKNPALAVMIEVLRIQFHLEM
jgi:hypothetical protein